MCSTPHVLCPAFSREMLLNDRWLLKGCPGDAQDMWADILEMTEQKQILFMKRVLFVHSVTKKKAGRAQILRLAPAQWQLEADIACLTGSIMGKMKDYRDPANNICFTEETMIKVTNLYVEGFLEAFS